MKENIESLLDQALDKLISDGLIETKPALQITRTKDAAHGDFTCNVAMMLAKQAGKPPREIAQAIIEAIGSQDSAIEKIEIAGPGFINFFLAWWCLWLISAMKAPCLNQFPNNWVE